MDSELEKKVWETLKSSFLPEKAAGVDAVMQIHATGPGGGDWVVTIKDKAVGGYSGIADSPNLTLTASLEDLQSIFENRLDPTNAFFQGRLHLQGDLGMGLRLIGLFKRG